LVRISEDKEEFYNALRNSIGAFEFQSRGFCYHPCQGRLKVKSLACNGSPLTTPPYIACIFLQGTSLTALCISIGRFGIAILEAPVCFYGECAAVQSGFVPLCSLYHQFAGIVYRFTNWCFKVVDRYDLMYYPLD
jgi:hypothetical protein